MRAGSPEACPRAAPAGGTAPKRPPCPLFVAPRAVLRMRVARGRVGRGWPPVRSGGVVRTSTRSLPGGGGRGVPRPPLGHCPVTRRTTHDGWRQSGAPSGAASAPPPPPPHLRGGAGLAPLPLPDWPWPLAAPWPLEKGAALWRMGGLSTRCRGGVGGYSPLHQKGLNSQPPKILPRLTGGDLEPKFGKKMGLLETAR